LRASLTREGVASAEVMPIRAGLGGEPAGPSPIAPLLFELLAALGSTPIAPHGAWGELQ
jgi:hypothetical protein